MKKIALSTPVEAKDQEAASSPEVKEAMDLFQYVTDGIYDEDKTAIKGGMSKLAKYLNKLSKGW